MAYVKPQVLVYQEFASTMTSQDTAMRPWIVGRLADIHKRGEAVIVEDYWGIKDTGLQIEMPKLQLGSSIDEKSVKVYADNAILRYAAISAPEEIPDENYDDPYAYSVSGKPNQIKFTNFNVTSRGNDSRSALLGKRDVAPDDIVRISAYVADIAGVTKCKPVEFVSKIIGFIPNNNGGTAGKAARTTNKNEPAISNATGTYTGSVADDWYTIHIGKTTYSVTSASGKDSYPIHAELPEATETTENDVTTYSYTFTIGKDALEYTVTSSKALAKDDVITDIHLSSSAFTAGSAVFDDDLTTAEIPLSFASNSDKNYSPLASGKIKETFQVQVTDINYTELCKNIELRITSDSGFYNRNDQAIPDTNTEETWEFDLIPDVVHCTIAESDRANLKIGQKWVFTLSGAYTPATLNTTTTYSGAIDDTFVITCVSGGTASGAIDDASPKVTIRTFSGSEFKGPFAVKANDAITSMFGTRFTFSDGEIALGETWIVKATTDKDEPYEGIIIRDAIPDELRTVGTAIKYLDVDLCVLRDIEISPENIDSGINWELDGTNIHIDDNIKVTLDEFVDDNGVAIPLDLLDGTISVAYREWLIDGAEKFNYVNNLDDIDAIPGPLSPENPLKYGVYKALSNSGWHTVVYTTVTGDELDDWSNALAVASGSREIYTVVPLSQDLRVLKLAATLVTSDSNEETCAWKNCFLSIAAPSEQMLVGQSIGDTLHPTSTNGSFVTAKILATGSVEITSTDSNGLSNADLSNVRLGDVLRVKTGDNSFVPYIIKSVSGNNLLTIQNPPEDDIEDTIEIWHTFTRAEQADYVADVAQSFSNRRVKLVWPDVVGEAGQSLPGTFLCAALAGLVGGSVPNQGLTRVTISGFDDMSRAIPYFTESQIKQLASSGVWIVTEDLDGTIFTMHGLTTSTVSLQYSEEIITRIVDFMSLELRNMLEGYIGVTNITSQTIESIRDDLGSYMEDAASSSYSSNGPLVIDYEILDISQDALLKDRINVILSVEIPKATNNIVLRIQAE